MKLKKNKIWILGLGAGLMATTGIATPLIVSCSSNDPSKPQDTDGNDKKYNITQATYDNLEKQLIFKYQHKKMAEGLLGDNLNDEMDNLQTQLNSLRKESNKVSYNYTFRTNCLIDLAIKNYGIQISRGFSSSLDEDFQAEKENYGNAYRRYLLNNHFSPTSANTLVRSFGNNFSTLKGNICAQFDDPLYSLHQLKANLLSCFDDATKELEYAHTQQLINQLFKEYNFTYNGTALFDEFTKKSDFTKDSDIQQYIPKIFNCTKTSSKSAEIIPLGKDWTTTLVPNYVIKPILRNIESDIYSNMHSIQIDWGLMPVKYISKDPIEQEKAIAYYSAPKPKALEQKIKSFDDYLNLKTDDKFYAKTEMHISKKLEKENIKKAYGNLTFSYSNDRKDHAYEEFGACLGPDGKLIETGIGVDSLVKTGLMIKEPEDKAPVLAKDIINKIYDLVKYNTDLVRSTDYKPTLKENFLSFTNIVANSKIVNDNEHLVNSDILVWYRNSPYENNDLAVQLNDSPIVGKGIVYSSQFYDNALSSFNNARKIYKNLLNLSSEDNGAIARFSLEISIQTIIGVATGISIAASIFTDILNPTGNKGLGIAIIVLSILLEIATATVIVLDSLAIRNAIKHKNAVKELISCDAFKSFESRIKNDAKMYDNKETFLMSPLSVVQPSVNYFKNLTLQDDYKYLIKRSGEINADKSSFDQTITFISKIVNYVVLGFTIGLLACLVIAFSMNSKPMEAEEAATAEESLQKTYEWGTPEPLLNGGEQNGMYVYAKYLPDKNELVYTKVISGHTFDMKYAVLNEDAARDLYAYLRGHKQLDFLPVPKPAPKPHPEPLH